MSSSEDSAPAKMKRTSFSPWSSGVMGSKTSAAPKKDGHGPEPARIVSDILEGAAVKTSAVGGLADSARIMALQREWDRKQREQPTSRSASAGPPAAPSLRNPRKRDSPALDNPAIKRQYMTERRVSPDSSTDGSAQLTNSSQARASARRFTEAEVAKQMSELTGASVKKSAMNFPTMTATSPPQSSASMHFPTGGELLKKIMGSQASTSPSPGPAPAISNTASQSPASPAPGDRIVAIVMAEPGRAYSMYKGPDGATVSGRGALIPAKYQLHDNPELPFVCPVRDCRRLFSGLKGLGGHFGAGHCSTTFNDNGDGTLSKIGNYVKHGAGGSPGIVVSRNPLPPNAPPPADPGLSVFAAMAQKRESGNVTAEMPERKQSARLSDAASKDATPVSTSSRTTNVKEYLHNFLSPAQREHQREDVTYMLNLPRQRGLPSSWIQNHRGGDLDIHHYACALAYLTGKETTTQDSCKVNWRTHMRPSARLSTLCITLPPNMPLSAKQAFCSTDTCVGCKYYSHLQRQRNICDWAQSGKQTSSGSVRSSEGSEGGSTKSEAMEVDEPDEAKPEPVLETVTETATEPKRTRRHIATQGVSTDQVMMEQSIIGVMDRPGQMGGVELEMEEWEVAPGRMRDDSSSDNVAFSNSYLTSGQPVTVSEGVSFNVLVIKPGSASHWPVEDYKLRTCSVAAGKVRVTMGEKTFQLGPNGMFVVRPGQTCKVENRLYLDSVVHCTTIDDFGLQ